MTREWPGQKRGTGPDRVGWAAPVGHSRCSSGVVRSVAAKTVSAGTNSTVSWLTSSSGSHRSSCRWARQKPDRETAASDDDVLGYSRWTGAVLIPGREAEDLYAGWWQLIEQLGAVL